MKKNPNILWMCVCMFACVLTRNFYSYVASNYKVWQWQVARYAHKDLLRFGNLLSYSINHLFNSYICRIFHGPCKSKRYLQYPFFDPRLHIVQLGPYFYQHGGPVTLIYLKSTRENPVIVYKLYKNGQNFNNFLFLPMLFQMGNVHRYKPLFAKKKQQKN